MDPQTLALRASHERHTAAAGSDHQPPAVPARPGRISGALPAWRRIASAKRMPQPLRGRSWIDAQPFVAGLRLKIEKLPLALATSTSPARTLASRLATVLPRLTISVVQTSVPSRTGLK